MHRGCSTNHGRIIDSSLSGSCVLLSVHLMVGMLSVTPFDALSPFTASFVVTAALHIFVKRVLHAMIAGSVSLFRVTSR